MDLKIKDVADLLNVSETTIRRWLGDSKIPAYKLNGQYRFSRIEIENWMMSQKLQVRENLIGPKEMVSLKDEKTKTLLANQIGSQAYSLFRAVYKGGVVNNVEGNNKKEVIFEAVKIIAANLGLDADVISELLIDRENLMPTALNHGIAVPHTRDFLLQKPFDVVTVVYLDKPIEYGALDGLPVHTLFFLFANQDKTHLHLLAKLAHLTRSNEAMAFLQRRPSKKELLSYLKEWEVKVRTPLEERV